MGTGCSVPRSSQPQSQPSELPSNNKAVKRVIESKPSPRGAKPLAVEETAADQANLSDESNHEATAAKDVKEMEKRTVEQVVKQQLPHNYEAILKDADSPIRKSSMGNLLEQLHAGILLNQKRKKYWVDKKSNNCFMVYARDLSITWSEDKRYWRWSSLEETSDVFIDAAELLDVCWLEVHGKLETTNLSPGTLYDSAFVVMLKDASYGWEVPVTVILSLPDGNKESRRVNMMEIPRERWIEIPIGEFRSSPEKLGEIDFSMHGYEGGKWKSGLVIKGVAIRPKH